MVATARTVGGLEELDDAIKAVGGTATLVPLELRDTDGIARLAAALNERYQQARHPDRQRRARRLELAARSFPAEGMGRGDRGQRHRQLAADPPPARAAAALRRRPRGVPHLRRAANPRAYRGLYAASKAALEAIARTYAAETASTPIRVNLFNPGPTRTRMRAAVMPGEDPMTLPTPEEVAAAIVPLCRPDFNETGKLYDFRAKKLLSFRPPA